MSSFLTGPIKDFVLGIYDGPHATPKEADEGPIFLGIKNVTPQGILDFSVIRNVSEEEYPKWTRRIVPRENDIVFSYEATLHRYALIPEGFRGCLGRRMALVRPDPEKVHPHFLHYYFLTSSWRAVVEANIISGATVDRVPLKRFPDFEVRLPELEVQQRIASILSAYDDLIENNRRRIQLLEQAARLLYKEWFVHLRFPEHEHVKFIDGVPEGWERKPVVEVWKISYGKNLPTKFITSSGKYPVHGADGIIGYHTEKNVNSKLSLVTCRGNGSGNVRRTFGPTFVTNNCFILRPNYKKDLLRFHFAIMAMEFLQLRELRTGAAQPQLTLSGINHLQITVPSKSILTLYNSVINPIFSQMDGLRQQNEHLSRARDLLLPRLMNGEITV